MVLVYVWGCAQSQRDFYQAPPSQPARWALATSESQDWAATVATALSRQGYDFAPLDSVPSLLHGEIQRDGAGIGQIIAVGYEPESKSHLAIEVRIGLIGNPAMEQKVAQATADQITAAGGGPAASAPGPGWSESALSGRWIDLESAVSQAGSTPKSPDLAVSSIDRWRYATFFDLRPLGPEEARLIVIGDRHNAAGPHAAYLRIGLFGNPAREKAYLRRLRTTLSELGRVPRPAGSR